MPQRRPGAVDPYVLGKIILIQSTVHVLPTFEAMVDFVARGLEELPGTENVTVAISNVSHLTAVTPPVLSNGPAGRSTRPSKRPPKNSSPRDFSGGSPEDMPIPIQTLHRNYGTITFRTDGSGALGIYRPFLESLANAIALIIENREQEHALQALNQDLVRAKDGLEALVRKRTADLVETNVTLEKEVEERKRYAASLAESEHKYRDLFENANDAIFLLDVEMGIVDVNAKAEELLGYTKEELLRRTILDLMPEELRRDVRREFLASTGSWSADKFTTQFQAKDARIVDVEISSSPISRDGKIVGSRDIVRDITDRIRDEKELLQSQKTEAIGRLAGGVAHDFNNILSAILGNAELALTRLKPDDPASKYFDRIRNASLRAVDLVKQILAFSRQTGEERSSLDLQIVVKEAVKLLHAAVPSNVEIVLQISPGTPCVIANPTHIHQIVMNLCTNAVHAMRPQGGILRISLGEYISAPDEGPGIPAGSYAFFEVSDTGCGMDPATKARIFDPYFTTKKKGEGTGLGLAVVSGIVRRMNGYIFVDSEPGKGSTFRVYCPATAKRKDETPEVETPLPRGTERIWVVDDEKDIVEMQREVLENLGYKVRTFIRPALLLGALEEDPRGCDLIVTDLGMPEIDGEKLSTSALALRPGIRILLCTGFSETMTEERAHALGIQKFLWKPITRESLAKAVRSILDA